MKRIILLSMLILLISRGSFPEAPDWSKIITKVQHAIVPIQVQLHDNMKTFGTICTGMVVGPETVLSATHCFEQDEWGPRFADGIPLTIGRHTEWLALLSAHGRNSQWEPISFRTSPATVGMPVMVLGYALGSHDFIMRGGYLAALGNVGIGGSNDLIFFDANFSHGHSGSPILDSHGQVISMAEGVIDDGISRLGYGPSQAVIRDFLNTQS